MGGDAAGLGRDVAGMGEGSAGVFASAADAGPGLKGGAATQLAPNASAAADPAIVVAATAAAAAAAASAAAAAAAAAAATVPPPSSVPPPASPSASATSATARFLRDFTARAWPWPGSAPTGAKSRYAVVVQQVGYGPTGDREALSWDVEWPLQGAKERGFADIEERVVFAITASRSSDEARADAEAHVAAQLRERGLGEGLLDRPGWSREKEDRLRARAARH